MADGERNGNGEGSETLKKKNQDLTDVTRERHEKALKKY